MKKLLVVIVIVLVAALAGWVRFGKSPDRAIFTIETEKMAEDAERAIDRSREVGRDLLDRETEVDVHVDRVDGEGAAGPST